MHWPTGGSQSLIAQNGPINDHTADADAFTSALREIVAAEAAATPGPRSTTAASAAEHAGKAVKLLEVFLIRVPLSF
jgi:hypothetical protein